MTQHRNPSPLVCPACGYAGHEASTNADGGNRAPKAGDVAVCAECQAVNVFVVPAGGRLGLAPMSAETLAELTLDERRELEAAIAASRAFRTL